MREQFTKTDHKTSCVNKKENNKIVRKKVAIAEDNGDRNGLETIVVMHLLRMREKEKSEQQEKIETMHITVPNEGKQNFNS